MSFLRHLVRVRLSGDRALTGTIHIAQGGTLCDFLGSKSSFLNLTQVHWENSTATAPLPHLSVRIDQISWVEPQNPTLQLSTAARLPEQSRKVELLVDGDFRLQVDLNVAKETRMSDYLEVRPSFIPLWSVGVEGEDREIDRVALNHSAIQFIRELEETDPRQSG